MRRAHKVDNRREEQGPDCSTCIHRKGCDRYAEGSFCTKWQSREPETREPDPNRLWETGEEVDL